MDSGDQQLRTSVCAALMRGERILLSGGAGTGKTYLVRRLARDLAQHKVITAITASTGLAATLLYEQIPKADHLYLRGPSTLHAAALLPISDDEDRQGLIEGGRRRLQGVRVVIIDEISMTDRLTFERFLLRVGRDVGILAVGDFFQLPPIRETIDCEPDFVFQSPEFRSFELVELTKNYRQDEPDFIEFLAKLRHGNLVLDYLAEIPEKPDYHYPVLFGTKLEARNHNTNQIQAIRSKSFFSDAKLLVGQPIEAMRWFEDHTRAMRRLQFKREMRVMCIQNLGAAGRILVANGDLGTIQKIESKGVEGIPESVSVRFDRLKASMYIGKYDFKKTVFRHGREETEFMVSQFPLIPAYGLTVHKAQGLTLDVANVDGARIKFAAGQVYVALSRCRTKGGLRIQNANFFNAFTRPQVEEYYRTASRFCPSQSPIRRQQTVVAPQPTNMPSPTPRANLEARHQAPRPPRTSLLRRLRDALFSRE